MNDNQKIWAYIDKELSDEERLKFERRLEHDFRLSTQLQETLELHNDLMFLSPHLAPSSIEEVVIEKVGQTSSKSIDYRPLYFMLSILVTLMVIFLLMPVSVTASEWLDIRIYNIYEIGRHIEMPVLSNFYLYMAAGIMLAIPIMGYIDRLMWTKLKKSGGFLLA